MYMQENVGRSKVQQQQQPQLFCPHCNKTFSGHGRQQLYERHVIVHTGEKPFVCLHCQYRANQLSNLRRHIRMQHSAEENQEFINQENSQDHSLYGWNDNSG